MSRAMTKPTRGKALWALLPSLIGPIVISALACSTPSEPHHPTPAVSSSSAHVEASAPEPVDPLGPPPVVQASPAFAPPEAQVFAGPGGSKIWLIERHNLPIVSVSVVSPYGASADPAGEPGLAYVTADMLDEGTSKRDALALSSALDELGAKLSSIASQDMSSVHLESLADRFDAAVQLLGEAIVKPRHNAKDFQRVTGLWKNALQSRKDDANETARIATTALFFGSKHPYSHPTDGTLAAANKITLQTVAANHLATWRPDTTTFVVVGDITKDALTKSLSNAFSGWATPKTPAKAIVTPTAPTAEKLRTFIVDRPDAPQVVMTIARQGVAVSDDNYPELSMMNIALGGSFTSRLNQNLREKHGWTYGAKSRFNVQRGPGMFVARAAIRTDAITPALKEALSEIKEMAASGPTAEEIQKIKAQAKTDVVETYESVRGIEGSLATNAGMGLAVNYDAKSLEKQQASNAKGLAKLASSYLSLDSGIIVLVGPKAECEAALAANQLPKPELRDAEGNPITTPPATKTTGKPQPTK